MSNTINDTQVNELVRAARVAGRTQPGTGRTEYLSGDDLRGASLPRVVTEVSRAENPDASETWRQRRRGQLGDEFDRRGFPDSSAVAREEWQQARYAEEQARIAAQEAEQDRVRAEAARAQAQQTGVGTGPIVAAAVTAGVGVVGLAAAGETLSPDQADTAYLAGEHELSEQWSSEMSDPAVGGEPLTPTEGGELSVDVADSLSASPSASPEPAAPTPTVEHDPEHSPGV